MSNEGDIGAGIEKRFAVSREGMVEAQAFLELYQDDPKPAIIMDEIVSNIVRCSGASWFSISLRQCADGFRMEFTDDGKPFDPTTEVATPDITASAADRDIGGLGIFMVKKMSKSVTYRREDGKNVLTVVM